MATADALDRLKRNWLADPCYDLYGVDGFEAHEDELRAFQTEMEARWKKQRDERLWDRANALGCSVALVAYLETLERRIAQLDRLLED